MTALLEGIGHMVHKRVSDREIRISGIVEWELLDQSAELFDSFLWLSHQQVVAATGAVFFPVCHAVNPRHSHLVVLQRLLLMAQIRDGSGPSGIGSTHVWIELNGPGIVRYGILQFSSFRNVPSVSGFCAA